MNLRLAELRKAKKIKQKDLAALLGIPLGTYRGWEYKQSMLNLAYAVKIADILDCSLDELAGREFNPQKLGVQETNLLNSFRDCTPERKSTLIQHAKDAALASKRRSPALVT